MSKEMREHIDKYKTFILKESYMENNVDYKWVEKILKKTHLVDFTEDLKKRKNILKIRKNELVLNEFQTLFEYWSFCETNKNIVVGHNELKNYIPYIEDWVFYLTLCQLFPEELKSSNFTGNRDLYSKCYEQILNLPKLSGDIEKDKVFFYEIIRNEFFKQESPVRNCLILYYIYFKKDRLL